MSVPALRFPPEIASDEDFSLKEAKRNKRAQGPLVCLSLYFDQQITSRNSFTVLDMDVFHRS